MNLVERLATKWHHEFCCDSDELDDWDINEARWWLNAIADELEQHENTIKGVMRTLGVETGDGGAAVWLRSQAKGGTDD